MGIPATCTLTCTPERAALAEYFERIVRGEQVWGRAWEYSSATPRNRAALVDALASSASQLDSGVGGGDDVSPVSELDCLEAARFVCTDFPRKQATRAYTLAERVATAQDPSARVTHVSFCAALRTTLLLRELLDELKRSVWKDTERIGAPAVLKVCACARA